MLLLKIVSIFQSIEVRLSTAQQLPPSMSSSWVGIDSGFFGEQLMKSSQGCLLWIFVSSTPKSFIKVRCSHQGKQAQTPAWRLCSQLLLLSLFPSLCSCQVLMVHFPQSERAQVDLYLGMESRVMCNSVFNCLTDGQAVFQSGCTIFHSHPQCVRVPVSPHPHQCLLLSILKNSFLLN